MSWQDILKKLVECSECGHTRETDSDVKCPLCDETPTGASYTGD